MHKVCFVLLTLVISQYTNSKEVTIKLLNTTNQIIPNVVVYLKPQDKIASGPDDELAIMDQIDTQFTPHILVVQKDTNVHFPNSDSIKHHVYSFSPAKTFELQLYKGFQADPMLFSTSGVVELGCNVHDWMLGYVFVVDTPYFGKTDPQGLLKLNVPEGEYQLDIWHPRIQDDLSTLSMQISVSDKSEWTVQLKEPLIADFNQYEAVSEFSDYE